MADGTHIEWCDATWQPITGCSIVSPGCTNCYAMRLAGTRLKDHPSRAGLTRDTKAGPVWTGEVRFNEQWLDQPLRWRKPRRIFVCAHGDLFAENAPDAWIDRVFAVMALAPWHTFLVLTKRAARMQRYFEVTTGSNDDHDAVHQRVLNAAYDLLSDNRAEEEAARLRDLCEASGSPLPLPNVWLGVSVEDQARADERIPHLLATPAEIRFISAEPLLGPIDVVSAWLVPPSIKGPDCFGLDWVITGGESGPNARPMHPDWARSLRDQCAGAGVPFFFKQWGEWTPEIGPHIPVPLNRLACVRGDGIRRDTSEVEKIERREGDQDWKQIARVGKRAAGRLLDGVEYSAFPAS